MTPKEHDAMCAILTEAEFIWKRDWQDDMTKDDYVIIDYVESTDDTVFCDLRSSKDGVDYSEEIKLPMHIVRQYMNKEITIKKAVGHFS